jgi:hypothetical protein
MLTLELVDGTAVRVRTQAESADEIVEVMARQVTKLLRGAAAAAAAAAATQAEEAARAGSGHTDGGAMVPGGTPPSEQQQQQQQGTHGDQLGTTRKPTEAGATPPRTWTVDDDELLLPAGVALAVQSVSRGTTAAHTRATARSDILAQLHERQLAGPEVAAGLDSEAAEEAAVLSSSLDGRLARVAQELRGWAGGRPLLEAELRRARPPPPSGSGGGGGGAPSGSRAAQSAVYADPESQISPLTSEEEEEEGDRVQARHSALLRRLDAAAVSRDASHRRRHVERPRQPRLRRRIALDSAGHRSTAQDEGGEGDEEVVPLPQGGRSWETRTEDDGSSSSGGSRRRRRRRSNSAQRRRAAEAPGSPRVTAEGCGGAGDSSSRPSATTGVQERWRHDPRPAAWAALPVDRNSWAGQDRSASPIEDVRAPASPAERRLAAQQLLSAAARRVGVRARASGSPVRPWAEAAAAPPHSDDPHRVVRAPFLAMPCHGSIDAMP